MSWGADSLPLFVFSQAICYTFLAQIFLLITVLWTLSVGQPCFRHSSLDLQKHMRTLSAALNCLADEGQNLLSLRVDVDPPPPPKQRSSAQILGVFDRSSAADSGRQVTVITWLPLIQMIRAYLRFVIFHHKKKNLSEALSQLGVFFTMNYFPAQGPNHVFG